VTTIFGEYGISLTKRYTISNYIDRFFRSFGSLLEVAITGSLVFST
jgi:hypothetical protein